MEQHARYRCPDHEHLAADTDGTDDLELEYLNKEYSQTKDESEDRCAEEHSSPLFHTCDKDDDISYQSVERSRNAEGIGNGTFHDGITIHGRIDGAGLPRGAKHLLPEQIYCERDPCDCDVFGYFPESFCFHRIMWRNDKTST